MGVLKTILFCMLGLLPAGAFAMESDPLRTFASCAGRLSATMEHQWLMSDPTSDRTQAQRAAMLSLVDAVMAPGQGSQVLTWRIEAKQAHAVLLTRAAFGQDADDATWALQKAEAHLAQCTGLLLS